MTMKRRILCIFALVAYLLVFCTVFSPMAQREMSVLVTVRQLDGSSKHNNVVSIHSYRWGNTKGLFQVVEGTGWNSGDRIAEISSQYYVVNSGYFNDITLHPGTPYTLVLSATKTPQEGDPVQIVTQTRNTGEKLILYTPEGYYQSEPLQNNFKVLQESESGILLDSIYLDMPFFEHTIRQSLSKKYLATDMRIYSYSEAESFLRQLPLIGLLAGMLLTGLILWAGTCLLTRKHGAPLPTLLNTGIAGLILVLMLPVTNAIDLPASLMPQNSILDIGHYTREFSQIFKTMSSFGDYSLQTLCRNMLFLSAGIILALVAGSLAVLFLERKYSKKTPIE